MQALPSVSRASSPATCLPTNNNFQLPCCPGAGEDDGWLMVYVTKGDGSSYMHLYDALTMDPTPVAEVRGVAEDSWYHFCVFQG